MATDYYPIKSPTEPGWWWFLDWGSNDWTPIEIKRFSHNGPLRAFWPTDDGWRECFPADVGGGQWYGPKIPEPAMDG